jgi:hypothetical protein
MRTKIKLKGQHFDTNEVIEAESQEVLITLKKSKTSMMHLEMAKALRNVHTRRRGLLRGWQW